MKPLKTNVLIQIQKPDEKTNGGIILPQEAQQSESKGTVLAVGPGVQEVVVGDVVYFQRYQAQELENGQFIAKEETLLAVEAHE
jgi:chaperonin GroES